MRENENPCETLKCLRAGFYIYIYIYGKCWVKYGYIVFWLNGFQWVFS